MKNYSLSHLSDQTLLHDLAAAVARSSAATADVLAHIAEVDARKLYLPAAYPSMYAYCVGELKLSEEAAYKRIHAARTARRFPALFAAVADGQLHLSAVILLAPYLTEDTAEGLLTAAMGRTKAGIEQLLAERFPRPDMLTWVTEVTASSGTVQACQHAPAHVQSHAFPETGPAEHAPGRVEGHPDAESGPAQHAPGRVGGESRVKPLSSESFALQLTMSRSTHDKLRRAQQLLGHRVPSGDLGTVLDRALDALIERLEKRKFAATSKPRPGRLRSSGSPRRVPADVKRTVWERDGGRCTFESETGRRCEARARLEFDHIEEFSRGGESTVAGIRLRCRAHNQYTAERTFGPEFMRHKRIAAAESRTNEKARASGSRAPDAARAPAAVHAPRVADDRDVIPWLRQLGFSASEARRGAVHSDAIPDASLEQRVRLALSCIGVRGTRMCPAGH